MRLSLLISIALLFLLSLSPALGIGVLNHVSQTAPVLYQSNPMDRRLSLVGMGFAATGHLSPVSGAIAQEIIDVLAVLNALRAASPPKVLHDL